MKKRILSIILAMLMVSAGFASVCGADNLDSVINDAIICVKATAGEYEGGFLSQRHLLPVGNTLSDWIALVFALNGVDDDYEGYLNDLKFYVRDCYEENGYLDRVKATEYHRIILTIYALGEDPATFIKDKDGNSIDLLADGTYNFHTHIATQGLNGVIFSLIALDAKDTVVPENAEFTREDMIDMILSSQEPDGGFGLAKGSSNGDITAMAIQALAKYYDREDVKTAVDDALGFMAEKMGEDGTFEAFGEKSSETISQLIIALTSLGIDPAEDERFIKNGKNLYDHAMRYLSEDGGFSHTDGGESDFMATQQMLLALTSVKMLRSGNGRIFDFTEYDGPTIAPIGEEKSSVPPVAVGVGIVSAAVITAGIIIKLRGKKNA